MQSNATRRNAQGTAPDSTGSTRQHSGATYQKVRDDRKRPIRGLWIRNGRYYAQLTLEDPHTGQKQVRRVPLEKATTAAQARYLLHEMQVDRRKGRLPILRQTPRFTDYATQYIEHHKLAKDTKRASTLETESYAINQWKAHIGNVRLNKINRTHIDRFIALRQGAGKSARTVNLEVTVLRNVLNKAIDDKWLTCLPTENLRPLKSARTKRGLVTAEDIERLCTVPFEPAFRASRLARAGETGNPLLNAQQFADYIKLMCYCGARQSEALRLRWADVDWQNRQLTIGADGMAKNGEYRVVDFNGRLETLLQQMLTRRAPDSQWLFPSPRRGDLDESAKTFRASLLLAREAVGLPQFGFHDCRHYFISTCVMSGIDFMTIARWVGHKDGGLLIGKVYGHLSNEHAKRQADRVNFPH